MRRFDPFGSLRYVSMFAGNCRAQALPILGEYQQALRADLAELSGRI